MKTILPEISLVNLLSSFQKPVPQLYLNIHGFSSFDGLIPYYPMFLNSLIAVCQNCWALIMNLFQRFSCFPVAEQLHPSTDSYCQNPATSSCEEPPVFSSLISIWSCEYHFLCKARAINPSRSLPTHSTPILETEKKKDSLLPTPPFFPLGDQRNLLGLSRLAITDSAISMNLCLLFRNQCNFSRSKCDSRSVIH